MAAQPQLEYNEIEERPASDSGRPAEDLGTLYQGVLTSIVRLQSERQHITDGDSFKRRTKSALTEIARVATKEGYDSEDVQDTHFAVVAFLDEVVLNSPDPARSEWERRTLQEELFGQAHAGVVFFERLSRLELKRDTPHLVNALEVFLLCLLLGFKGRHAGSEGVLEAICSRLAQRVRTARASGSELSPDGLPRTSDIPAVESALQPESRHFKGIMIGSIALTGFLFLLFYWNLSSISGDLVAALRG